MSDLAAFLLARIAEDKQAARDVALEEWSELALMAPGYTLPRVLAEFQAKRRIVEAHRQLTSYPVGVLNDDGTLADIPEGSFDAIVHTQHGCPTCAPIYSRDPCDTLRALAAPYAGHQGDRQHAESEMDDWAKEVGDEHVRLASRVVTEWRLVGQSDRRQDHHGVTGN